MRCSWFLVLACFSTSPQLRADSPDDPLANLNVDFRASYARARATILARSGPIVVAMGDTLTLLNGSERTEVVAIPPLYHRLKAVSHTPFNLFLISVAVGDAPLSEPDRTNLRHLRELIEKAQAALERQEFSAKQLERQRTMLTESLGFLAATLERGRFLPEATTTFTRRMNTLIQLNFADAAKAQLDGFHARMATWRMLLGPDQWKRLRVVVIGAQMPRKGNLAVQYFTRLLGEQGEGFRLVYAEALFDEQKAVNLLGTHLLDSEAGVSFFSDPLRMERDVLADVGTVLIKRMKFEDDR